ncbi:hypothetical protein Micbo1qcDRAFT_230419 [Microdochium bolleyi]|uniref:Meiotic recombination protein DMC1 n=1 Tax=Microdochium bolleyi TaxID=196109 RepID=A0A136JD79_9PEZI|nr:hypothetical protein Micbo1qcDRAFT_230419 [Microdochium bolleyi]
MAARQPLNSSQRSNAGTPQYATGGGFFRTSLPSPAPSTASSRAAARLPHPRSKPLLPGSRKEDYARDYISQRMMHISRRFVKKHGIPDPADVVTGYESMDEVCADMEEVVDVLWFSGTPSIQVPTMLALALALNEYLPSFPPAPRPTFGLLQKLDHCFASLLVGRDVKTNEALAGFLRGPAAGFSRTDMVRIKSLADETRMLVAVVMSGEVDVEDVEDDDTPARPPADPFGKTPVPAKSTGAQQQSSSGDAADDDGDLEIIEDAMAGGRVKQEQDYDDEEDEEAEGEEFIDVEPPTNKRKISRRQELDPAATGVAAGETTDQELADEAKKRIKMEDSDSTDMLTSSPVYKTATPARPTAVAGAVETDGQGSSMKTEAYMEDAIEAPAAPSSDHQFHWTVEDSDSGSDDGQTTQSSNSQQQQAPTQQSLSTTSPAQLRARAQQREIEDLEYDDDDDEAEEELHLNVAKVYEKTLTQLGETLGESIVDD